MSDLIERKDAIKALYKYNFVTKEVIEREIMSIPSADRPRGEWIPSDTDGFVCSVCKNGYRNQPTLMGRPMFEYCPCCGARMKGAEDEDN